MTELEEILSFTNTLYDRTDAGARFLIGAGRRTQSAEVAIGIAGEGRFQLQMSRPAGLLDPISPSGDAMSRTIGFFGVGPTGFMIARPGAPSDARWAVARDTIVGR